MFGRSRKACCGERFMGLSVDRSKLALEPIAEVMSRGNHDR
jgi:hypothetical protein